MFRKKTWLLSLSLLFCIQSFATEPTHLYLVRHGKTDRNKEKKLQGQDNFLENQLNQEGKEQAYKAGQLLKSRHPTISKNFYTSPLGRAHETGLIAAEHFEGITFIKKTDPQEISHGTHDGMDAELRNRFCKQYYERQIEKFRMDYPDKAIDPYFKWKINPFSGAETCYSLFKRATKALVEIAEENPGKEIAIFTHGGLTSSLVIHSKFQNEIDQILPL